MSFPVRTADVPAAPRSAREQPGAGPDEATGHRLNYRLVALIVACAMFMENLDATALTTALPAMAREFGVRVPQMSVTVTAYLLALAVFIPVSGYMADRFGARTVFRAAILVFMGGSLGCALSPSLGLMSVARFVQGMGGAMMVPVGRLVLLRTVRRDQLVDAMAWLLMPGLIGTISGPPLGGFIVSAIDWRWIFWINLPIGVLGMVLVGRYIGSVRAEMRRLFDGRGFVLSALALAMLMIGFELAGPAGEARSGWALIAGGLALGLLYLRHAARTAYPILDLSLLRIATFRLSMAGGSLTRIVQGAQPFLLSLMMQLGFGYSAAQSGGITFMTSLGTFLMKGLARRILRRLGFRTGLILLGLLGTSTYAVCGFFRPDWPLPAILCVLVSAGFFLSFQFTAYNSIAYDDVPDDRMSGATSFYSTIQQMTLSLGICTAATVLHVATAATGRVAPTLEDFSLAFWIVAGVSFCAVFVNMRFAADAGARMSGHAPAE